MFAFHQNVLTLLVECIFWYSACWRTHPQTLPCFPCFSRDCRVFLYDRIKRGKGSFTTCSPRIKRTSQLALSNRNSGAEGNNNICLSWCMQASLPHTRSASGWATVPTSITTGPLALAFPFKSRSLNRSLKHRFFYVCTDTNAVCVFTINPQNSSATHHASSTCRINEWGQRLKSIRLIQVSAHNTRYAAPCQSTCC